MALTTVYIDGLNLYYRALVGSASKWLDLVALSEAVLPDDHKIQAVKYYTAHVSGRVDPDAPKRQHAYLRALQAYPVVSVFFGNFITQMKWSGLVQPPIFRPEVKLDGAVPPQVAFVWKTEEKGSDVNLGVHIVRDAFLKRFEVAAVLTNDTDLKEPIRIVTQELGLPVILLAPCSQPATSLVRVSSGVRHVKPYLGPCQLPNPVKGPNGKTIWKPGAWEKATNTVTKLATPG